MLRDIGIHAKLSKSANRTEVNKSKKKHRSPRLSPPVNPRGNARYLAAQRPPAKLAESVPQGREAHDGGESV